MRCGQETAGTRRTLGRLAASDEAPDTSLSIDSPPLAYRSTCDTCRTLADNEAYDDSSSRQLIAMDPPVSACETASLKQGSLGKKDGRTRQPSKLRWRSALSTPSCSTMLLFALICCLVASAQAATVSFQNCLSSQMISGDPPPKRLQFDPLSATATLNLTDPAHTLNITVYGNVTGQTTKAPLEPYTNKTYWNDLSETNGRIIDEDNSTLKYSTLFPKLNVLNYNNYATSTRFCGALINGGCPLGPVFEDVEDLQTLPALTFSHPLEATYGFTTINARLTAEQGDVAKSPIACIQVDITPFIGKTAQTLTTYLPLIILILVAVATTCAALFSPWGTWDIFRATSNYGREVRLLRIMTPGFGDCLNYLQFIVLTGSLGLNYPGFFQPVVSNVAWSALMFNQSFVTRGPGSPLTVDGIYVASGTYGLDVMSQLVGMSSEQDMWAGMMIWLLVVIAAIVLLIQFAFLCRWMYRTVSKTQQEDLRAKNMPFSVGNAVRIIFNYFLLPIVALSMFQLVIAGSTPTPSTPAIAAVTILVLLGFSGWLVWIIINARPRSNLFDDLPTVLLYGPLYNTYSDNAAPFALVTIITTFIRGIAIGAVQSSGIAQIVLLAICEVIFMLTLNAFRPFFSGTYMNFINTVFSITRLIIVLLMVAFVPQLDIDDASKGYIGYVILILHALVLFAGFFIRVISTVLELIARAAGAGEDSSAIGGFARVLGLRQLARRNGRDATRSRASYSSNATMLGHAGQPRDLQSAQRSRSMSASSGLLLNNHNTRQSVALESVSGFGGGFGTLSHTGTTPSTINGVGPGSAPYGAVAGQGTLANLRGEPADPYFRAPRARRTTFEMQSPEPAQTKGSMGSGEWAELRQGVGIDTAEDTGPPGIDITEAGLASVSGRATPMTGREHTDSFDERRPKPDYATREVDYYYGVRGPALSHMPTRRLKTGPADPTGPVSSATGWFRGFFGGKTKEKGKGFEVVRSARMPPQMEMEEKELEAGTPAEPYQDEPESSTAATRPRHFALDDEGDAVGGGTRHVPGDPRDLERGRPAQGEGLLTLPDIETGGSIHMPSRWNSTASGYPQGAHDEEIPDVPEVPRKSSRRDTSHGRSAHGSTDDSAARLSAVPASPPDTPGQSRIVSRVVSGEANRDSNVTTTTVSTTHWPLPARSSTPQRLPFGNTLDAPGVNSRHARTHSAGSIVSAVSDVSRTSEVSALSTAGTGARDSASVRGARRGGGAGDMAGNWGGRGNNGDAALSRGDSSARALTPGFERSPARPSSLGYVQQHRASDGFHVVAPSEHTLTGSSAEFFEAEERERSTERRR